MTRKRKKSPPIKRYVYLIEKVGYTPGFLRRRRIIKIGVSSDPERRIEEIRSEIKGRFALIFQVKVKAATRVESDLHKRYAAKNAPIVGRDGKIREEFFLLTSRQIAEIQRELSPSISSVDWLIYLIAALFGLLLFAKSIKDS